MKFKAGDKVRNIHSGIQGTVARIDKIEAFEGAYTVYHMESGDRFNTDYEEHWERVEVER